MRSRIPKQVENSHYSKSSFYFFSYPYNLICFSLWYSSSRKLDTTTVGVGMGSGEWLALYQAHFFESYNSLRDYSSCNGNQS